MLPGRNFWKSLFLRNLFLAPIVLSSSIVCWCPSFTTCSLSHLHHFMHSTQRDCSQSWILCIVLRAQWGRDCGARSLLTSWLCRKGRVTTGATKKRQQRKPEGRGFVGDQHILLSQPSYFKAEWGISTGRLNLQGKGFSGVRSPLKNGLLKLLLPLICADILQFVEHTISKERRLVVRCLLTWCAVIIFGNSQRLKTTFLKDRIISLAALLRAT